MNNTNLNQQIEPLSQEEYYGTQDKAISTEQLMQLTKYMLFGYIIISMVVKLDQFFYISPKLGVPGAATGDYGDFFNSFKLKLGLALLIQIMVVFSILLFKKELLYQTNDYLLFFFMAALLVSTIISEYKTIAVWGTFNRFAGLFFIFMIVMIFFIASKMEYRSSDFVIIDYLLMLMLTVNVTASSLYYAGINLLTDSRFFQMLLFVPQDQSTAIGGYVLGSIENPNYYSGIAGFLFVFFLCRFLFEKHSISPRFFVLVLLTMTMLIFSRSSSGWISLMAVIPFLSYYLYQNNRVDPDQTLGAKMLLLIPAFVLIKHTLTTISAPLKAELISLTEFIKNISVYYSIYFIAVLLFLWVLQRIHYQKIVIDKKKYWLLVLALAVIAVAWLLPVSDDFGRHPPQVLYSQQEIMDTYFDTAVYRIGRVVQSALTSEVADQSDKGANHASYYLFYGAVMALAAGFWFFERRFRDFLVSGKKTWIVPVVVSVLLLLSLLVPATDPGQSDQDITLSLGVDGAVYVDQQRLVTPDQVAQRVQGEDVYLLQMFGWPSLAPEIINKLENRQDFNRTFSGRETIWAYTIDLTKERFFTGYGLNSLMLEYPHTSILALQDHPMWYRMTIDKPHNHYLEILYGGGIAALVLFLVLFFSMTIDYLGRFRQKVSALTVAFFLSMLAFLVQGLANDIDVSTYPVMFLLMGIGASILQNNLKEKEVHTEND